MVKHWMPGIILLLVAGVLFSTTNIFITVYNTMVTSKVEVERALSNLDAMYQRRYALIENFVTIVKEVKGFEQYQIEIEKDFYPRVAEAKAQATRLNVQFPETVAHRVQSEEQLGRFLLQAFDKLLVNASHYPTITDPVLKDRQFTFTALADLKTSLTELEQNIQFHRESFNEAIRVYNQNIQIFPANLLASSWHFTPLTGFEVQSEDVRHDVKIEF